MDTPTLKARFQLGECFTTPGVLALLKFPQMPLVELAEFLHRHMAGEWGEGEPSDHAENERALEEGRRVMSVYMLGGEQIWIMTNADRLTTTILTPEEY